MDRLLRQLQFWLQSEMPTFVGGDFNVIPEDIDCHKPSSWMRDALFQPDPRARYRAFLKLGYTDAFRSLHPGEGGQFTFWNYFRKSSEYNRGIRIDHLLLSPKLAQRLESCEIDKAPRAMDKPSDHTPIIVKCGISSVAVSSGVSNAEEWMASDPTRVLMRSLMGAVAQYDRLRLSRKARGSTVLRIPVRNGYVRCGNWRMIFSGITGYGSRNRPALPNTRWFTSSGRSANS